MGNCVTTQKDFDALKRSTIAGGNIQEVKNILQNFDLTATDKDGRNCLMLCYNSSSPEVVNVVLEKIEATGGPSLLKSQLTATDNKGRNCLMLCARFSSSPEVVKVIIKKIEETGGDTLLKSQLAATDGNRVTSLMHVCSQSSSPEVMKVVLEKIEETGGPDLLKSQLTATDDDGKNCLMLCARWSTSPEVAKVILKKIGETSGPGQLKNLLTATDKYSQNCLVLCCRACWAPQLMKLFAVVLFHFDLFKEQFVKLNEDDKNRLKRATGIDSASWTPDAASLAEVEAILQGAEATALAKKKAEEVAAAKKKAEEEAAALAKKKKTDSKPPPSPPSATLEIKHIQESTLNIDRKAPIGSGATCSVYSCKYSSAECAAKIFHSHIISDKNLQREMNAAVHLKHPNIVNVVAIIVGDTDKSKIIGILMERMNGTLLQRTTNAAPFGDVPPPTVIQLAEWCFQTATAILCAHSLKCIHCDIKPENVMLDPKGNAKLTDFGSAHVISTAATKVTSVRGTALFIAPEYAAGVAGPNEKTDVFSFGMLMWVVFHPKDDHGVGKTEMQIGLSLHGGKRPEINKKNVPTQIVSLIEKCWSADPKVRPEMADALTVFNEVITKLKKPHSTTSFCLPPSPLWTDARYLKSRYGSLVNSLASLKWTTPADAPSLHFSEDITDKRSPLFKFVEQKFRPSLGFKKAENNQSDTHFSGKFSRLKMVQPADAHHLFLALHEADGSSRSANAFLRHKNNSDSATQNALGKLTSVFEDPEVNPETNNANFSRILFGWHGTNASIAEKVCRDGPRSLRLTDAGFFGAGSYFSLEADYAANYAYMSSANAKGEYAIILFAVSLSQTYPITLQHDYRSKEDSHRPEMHGFSNFYNGPDPKKAIALAPKCDSHFIPVKKHGDGTQHPLGKYDVVNGNTVVEKDKTRVACNLDQQACDAKDPEVFGHEIVIGNHQRAVPVAILYFK